MDTEIYDFIIIGCGAVGSAVARELTLLGQKCLILEKNQEVWAKRVRAILGIW